MHWIDYLSTIEYSNLDALISGFFLYIETYLELNSATSSLDDDEVNEPGYVYFGTTIVHLLKLLPTVLVFFYRVYRIHSKVKRFILKRRARKARAASESQVTIDLE